ncbi:MAG: Acetoin:2,6-dichlorophenolindophenol oxidoreductase subunit alpha [Burkholderiaceae bacterium]|nr:Acetoin:2,6-dichlorophenolindophenol oxidoreductase subunit alpha [Burkholderiaceae bacterium]
MTTAVEQARRRVAADGVLLRQMYETMLASREIDRAAGSADGHWHAAEGEEAVIAACYCGLRERDWVAPHYRGMVAAALARGADLRRLLAGLTGKATSHSRGRYRSDVCAPIEHRLIGLYSGALGPTLEYATGTALAAKLDGSGAVAIAVFGDGTSSRGNAHEAINLAAVLGLGVVFVCQNNQYAISMPAAHGVGARAIADRGAAYGIEGVAVDGNDAIALRAAIEVAIDRARTGGGPTLIEAQTYRVSGHLVADPSPYRNADEVAAWRERDPIARLRSHLVSAGLLDEASDQALRERLRREVDAAMALAAADPAPAAETIGTDEVFAGAARDHGSAT